MTITMMIVIMQMNMRIANMPIALTGFTTPRLEYRTMTPFIMAITPTRCMIHGTVQDFPLG